MRSGRAVTALKRWGWLTLSLVGATLLALHFRSGGSDAPAPSTQPPPVAELETPAPQAAASLKVEDFDHGVEALPLTQTTADPALPALESPVIDWLIPLQQRAARGEPAANCRLAAALQDCASQPATFDPALQPQRDQQRLAEFRGSEGGRASLERILEQQSQELGARHLRCQGLSHDTLTLWPWYLLRAADAGYVDAMLTAIDPYRFSVEQLLRQPGLAEALHQRIPVYLQQLIERGSVRALGPLERWLQEPGMLARLGALPEGLHDPQIIAALTARADRELWDRYSENATEAGANRDHWQTLSAPQQVLAEQIWADYFGAGSEHQALLNWPQAELGRFPILPVPLSSRVETCAGKSPI